MIRSIHGILAHSNDILDPLVRAFVNATGITDPVIRIALNVFVLTLRTNNLLPKFDAIYPFVGGTAFTHKFNLMNAADTNAAFRLVFNGGYIHNANGINPNGTTAWADTFYNELTNSSLNNKHISIYSRSNINQLYDDMGVYDGVTTVTDIIPGSPNNFTFIRNSSSTGQFSNTDSRGFFLNNRTSSTENRAYKNSTLNVLASNSSFLINGNYYLNAVNNITQVGNPIFKSNRNLAFASIGRSLTDSEAVIFYNAVQTLQTALSRQV
jgi:hypothetical protein